MVKSKQSIMLVLLAATFWGTAGVFVRGLKAVGIESMQTVFGRAIFSVAIYGLVILFYNRSLFKISFKDIWAFFCLGFFSIVMFNFCYYKTMQLSTLSTAAVLLYTAPFFVIIISALAFKEKITLKKALSCVAAFIGCCFVAGAFTQKQSLGVDCIIYGLLTGFGYGLYTIFGNILLKKGYNTLTINFYAFVVAAVMSLPLSNPVATVKTVSESYTAVLLLFLMAVINTVIPYLSYTLALKNIEGSTALIIATLEPVVATLVGFFVFKEALSLHSFIGIVLVLGSVIILNVRGKNEAQMQCEN